MYSILWTKVSNSRIYRLIEEGQINKIIDYFNKIYEKKRFIGIVIIFFLSMGIISYNITSEYSAKASTILEYNYKGIEKGLDPAGRTLDVSVVESDEILSKVINDLDLKKYALNVEVLKNNLDIKPIVPEEIVENIKSLESEKNLNVDESYENSYYPSKYRIILNIPDEYDINNETATKILGNIVKYYDKFFYDKYSDKDTLKNVIGELKYNNYDYPEISTVINNQIFLINNFLSNKLSTEEGENFRSKKTGMSFDDIVESVNILKNIDVDRMDSIIGAYNLTKDKVKLIKLYQYRVQQLELQNKKKNDESFLASDIMNKYKKEKKTLVLPGIGTNGIGNDIEGDIEVTEDDKYYDSLAQRSTNSGVESKNAVHDANYYNTQIEKLENDNIDDEVKQKAEKEVVVLIEDIKVKLEDCIKITNNTMKEYYDENYLSSALKTHNISSESFVNKKLVLFVVISLLIGIFISILSITVKIYLIDEFKKVRNNIRLKNHNAYT